MTVDPMEGVSSNSTATAAGEAAQVPRRAASRRADVAVCWLGERLCDTLHDTAGNRVGVWVMRSVGDEPWLTGVFVESGAHVLHLRAGARC
jgi:hypothetical protein